MSSISLASRRAYEITRSAKRRHSLFFLAVKSNTVKPSFLSTYGKMTSKASKLHGRAFYESIGSPKYVVAPMVDQSEFAWRLLTRSFLPAEHRSSVLAYSPMLHAKLFSEAPKYRRDHFEPLNPPMTLTAPGDEDHKELEITDADLYLDGNKQVEDRPLFVQFCANDPDAFFAAAKYVQPYCDAVDLNLGCPQGIARKGGYGAFLQESPDVIYNLINKLHKELDVPVTAKFRIRETKEKTLEYAKMILEAGASIITVHGRLREQKGHNTGLADWEMIRYLRDNLPPETVIFANGNILQHDDIQTCLDETKADAVMSAEGNLYDPTIFDKGPPIGQEGREYFRGRDGKGGYRMDAVLRRYLDIIHKHVLGQPSLTRQPLFLPSDLTAGEKEETLRSFTIPNETEGDERPSKRQKLDSSLETIDDKAQPQQRRSKKDVKREQKQQSRHGKTRPNEKASNANMVAMQAHCFHLLRPLVAKHHDVRDALARCRSGDIDAYENVLALTEIAVKQGLLEYEKNPVLFEEQPATDSTKSTNPIESSDEAVRRCRRPYFVCQPYVRPLPAEAFAKGSMQLSKKEIQRLAQHNDDNLVKNGSSETKLNAAVPNGKEEKTDPDVLDAIRRVDATADTDPGNRKVAAQGLVCG